MAKIIVPPLPRGLAWRVVASIALSISFYILALSLVGLCLATLYFEFFLARHINPKVVLIATVAAGSILWSILPRFDRYKPPYQRIFPQDHPALFEEITEIAHTLQEKVPDEVYLLHDVNAAVSEYGGYAGFGKKRILLIGLPLLATCNRLQLRAVLAHEFGHFYGGDLKAGPWIYRSHAALARTIERLDSSEYVSWLNAPFRWYGKLFIRLSRAISRQQEYTADAVAASLAGTRATISALQATAEAGLVFDTFLCKDYAAILDAHRRPPFAEGFRSFLQGAGVQKHLKSSIAEHLQKQETSWENTHPALRDRIQALEGNANLSTDPPADLLAHTAHLAQDSALSLLRNLDTVEVDVINRTLTGVSDVAAFPSMTWEQAATEIYLPQWHKTAAYLAPFLQKYTIADAFVLLSSMEHIDTIVSIFLQNNTPADATPPPISEIPLQDRLEIATREIAEATSSTLVSIGWHVLAPLGDVHKVYPPHEHAPTKDTPALAVFLELDRSLKLPTAERDAAWRTLCQQWSISAVPYRTHAAQ